MDPKTYQNLLKITCKLHFLMKNAELVTICHKLINFNGF